MSGLYDYMTESEYELACIEAVFENQMKHLECEWNLLALEHEMNLHSIETKILMESGTVDDMAYLYAMEAEENSDQKVGILSRMVTAILNFLKRIKDTLFGRPEPKPEQLPEEVKVDDPKGIEKAFQIIKSNPAAAAAAVAGIAGGVVLTKNAVIPTIKDMKKMEEEIHSQCEAWQSELDKLKAKKKKSDADTKRIEELDKQLKSTNSLLPMIARNLKALVPGTEENDKLKEVAADRKEEEKQNAEQKAKENQQRKTDRKNAKAQKKEDDLNAEANKASMSVADLETKINEIDREISEIDTNLKNTDWLNGPIQNAGKNLKTDVAGGIADVVKAVGSISPFAKHRIASAEFSNKLKDVSDADKKKEVIEELKQAKKDLLVQRKKLEDQKSVAKASAKNAKATAKDYHNTRVANS